ncbi:stage V sporulation protein AB [Alkalihalophilus marmarensis]|uniref:stage V sporulation protein AB n=1 Tax=Alkalihalophilus marmarensis TaxID=521377 RepID=UPI002DB716BE|nr:stage V sporulation protein AB [Alkalihalophilus marmarensis]MEC2070702.1 stage V sporulation protein AB [Alkalihalophilus marmarensis]
MVIEAVAVMFIGLAGGIAVGSGLVAFLTVLGIAPRMTQLTKTHQSIRAYEGAIILGAQAGVWASFTPFSFMLPSIFLIPIGLACGMFVGMLAAALTEVLNVFPLLAKRIGVTEKIVILMMAIVFGKIAGSLIQWLFL